MSDSKKVFRFPKEKIIIFSIYAVVALFLIYLVVSSMIVPTEYVLKADNPAIFDSTSELYIDNSKALGPIEYVNGTAVRTITPTKFNIVFNPKNKDAWRDKNVTLELTLMGSGSELYINNELALPNFDDYDLVADYPDSQVYAAKSIRYFYDSKNLVQTSTPEEFVYKNFLGASVYSFRDASKNTFVPDVNDYKAEWTDLNATFRDNLNLAVFAEGTLQLNFTKQDLQNYLGPDEYTLEIKSQTGETLYSQIIPDDGVTAKTGKVGVELNYSAKVDNLPRGVYYISFTKDTYNDNSDSSLKNIKLNTNKIVILGKFLPMSRVNLYAKANYPSKITFYYWQINNFQSISITNNKKNSIINLDQNWLKTNYNQPLEKGEYTFDINKSNLWITTDFVALNKKNWFGLVDTSNTGFSYLNLIITGNEKIEIKQENLKILKQSLSNENNKLQIKTSNDKYSITALSLK